MHGRDGNYGWAISIPLQLGTNSQEGRGRSTETMRKYYITGNVGVTSRDMNSLPLIFSCTKFHDPLLDPKTLLGLNHE